MVDTCYQKHSFPLGYRLKQGAIKSGNTVISLMANERYCSEANPSNSNIKIFQEQYNNIMTFIQQLSS